MKKGNFTDEQIVTVLRDAEATTADQDYLLLRKTECNPLLPNTKPAPIYVDLSVIDHIDFREITSSRGEKY